MRTLEQAIETAFDKDRRLHGWAREGKDMGRDDFIDLAHVSKQVPGKTPNEVNIRFVFRARTFNGFNWSWVKSEKHLSTAACCFPTRKVKVPSLIQTNKVNHERLIK